MFALFVPFKAGRALTDFMILLVHHAPAHFVGGLATLLRKYHFQFASLDEKSVHFRTCFGGHHGGGVFDECESLRLMRVVVAWNVHILDFADPSEGFLEVFRGDIW